MQLATVSNLKCHYLSLRLKAVEILLNAMDDVNQQLSDHEHSLLSHDTMSSDRDALRSLQNQLRVRPNIVFVIKTHIVKLVYSNLVRMKNTAKLLRI